MEQNLRPDVIVYLRLVVRRKGAERLAVSFLKGSLPLEIALTALGVFDGAVEAVFSGLRVQGSHRRLIRCSILGATHGILTHTFASVQALTKTSVRKAQQLLARLVDMTVVYFSLVTAVTLAGKFLLGEQPQRFEFLQIDKIRIARKTGEGLIGRIAVSGGPERQNLPIALSRLLQAVNPSVGFD